MDAIMFEKSRARVYEAHNELLKELFGFVPINPGEYEVSRDTYKKAMEAVQKKFKLEEGDPDMLLFIIEQLSRSPRFIKGDENNELTTVR